MIDNAGAVRPGEELDLSRLLPYLRRVLAAPQADLVVEQFPGGHSNLTYLVRLGGRELVLRRPPFGSKVRSAHDMAREVRVLSRLAPVYARAPRPVHFCEDESVLGAKFYLMERISGLILRKQLPPGLAIDPPTAQRLCESFVDTLVELHALDYQAIGLDDFGKPSGYVERQVSGWSKRYRDAQTDQVPELEAAGAWLGAHIPAPARPAIIHNDYKYDNLILDPSDFTRIIGILDWEMSTIGDPLADLGTALCYWVQADDEPAIREFAFGPTAIPGSLTRRELAERYAQKSGRDLGSIVFYFVLGLFKSAVVVQQIYYRYQQGLTRDERFAALGAGVRLLAAQAVRAIERASL
ncbi:MAG TPA: phosphotransferase family protein [Polyangia bacterium]|nr:phosphotransferase family protein [Polyangia bacterium]